MQRKDSSVTATPDDTYIIRPAGRHLVTIGRDLIQNSFAAVLELVKNSYDADASQVNISFKLSAGSHSSIASYDNANSQKIIITIADNGHGMSKNVVINKWLVPSTRDKLLRGKSPNGRTMQGRKGIGRYAAAILGEDILLETITPDGEKTSVYLSWNLFEKAEYLDEVEVLVETMHNVNEEQGTRLTITGGTEYAREWTDKQFDNLRRELKKLISPVYNEVNNKHDECRFDICLDVNGFSNVKAFSEEITPYTILELYDYQISGLVRKDGKGLLSYKTQKARNVSEETINFDFKHPTGCGDVYIDICVYDRESDALDLLIKRGLKDDEGNYLGKREAKNLLDINCGVGVYRNGFRIRPLGDPDYDWLKLNDERIQNPSLRIGINQVIGYVLIQSEEFSCLIEKSARDGLKENESYINLKKIAIEIIRLLEIRRFDYRKKAGLSRTALKIEREFERLFSFDELKDTIAKDLRRHGIPERIASSIIDRIEQDSEKKNKVVDDIRQAVAVYQGQATLGKIINVVLHEGRRPLSYFKNQMPVLVFQAGVLQKNNSSDALEKILTIAKGTSENATVLSDLFKRIDPLAAGTRRSRKNIAIKDAIMHATRVFDSTLNSLRISMQLEGDIDTNIITYDSDLFIIFANLLDNSVYWINEKNSTERSISIYVKSSEKSLEFIDYKDSGPGIEPDLIAREVIFEPEFSTKPNGTGLGLAIAGEAAARNNLELKVLEYDHGAYFRLQPKS